MKWIVIVALVMIILLDLIFLFCAMRISSKCGKGENDEQ